MCATFQIKSTHSSSPCGFPVDDNLLLILQGTTSSTEITLRWWIMGSLTHQLHPNHLHQTTKPTTIKIKEFSKTTIAMPTFQEQPVSFTPFNPSHDG